MGMRSVRLVLVLISSGLGWGQSSVVKVPAYEVVSVRESKPE
jgi:hypothetical protein